MIGVALLLYPDLGLVLLELKQWLSLISECLSTQMLLSIGLCYNYRPICPIVHVGLNWLRFSLMPWFILTCLPSKFLWLYNYLLINCRFLKIENCSQMLTSYIDFMRVPARADRWMITMTYLCTIHNLRRLHCNRYGLLGYNLAVIIIMLCVDAKPLLEIQKALSDWVRPGECYPPSSHPPLYPLSSPSGLS